MDVSKYVVVGIDGSQAAANAAMWAAPEAIQLLVDYGRACGEVLARAHARTGDRIAIAGYLGNSDAADIAFTRFAEACAAQNDRDYAALREAARTHRLPTPEADP